MSKQRGAGFEFASPFGDSSGMSAIMRDFDWGDTELGPVEAWSQALRSAVSLCLGSRLSMAIYWGENHRILYNDAYRREILGSKHPWALAREVRTVWPEIYGMIGPWIKQTLQTGVTTGFDDAPLFLSRAGYLEEIYFSFSYTPILNEHGVVEGVFATLPETTMHVVGSRRLQTLQRLGSGTRDARLPESALQIAAQVIAENPFDIPFAAFYMWESDEPAARLCAQAGISRGVPLCTDLVSFSDSTASSGLLARSEVTPLQFVDITETMLPVPTGGWLEAPRQLAVLAIGPAGQDAPRAAIVAGVNPHKRLDDAYVEFYRMVSNEVARALADACARAREDESVRALRARALVAQQEERLRIARDIHDTLLQSVQGMRLLLEAGLAKYRSADAGAKDLFCRALAASVEAIDEGRAVLELLRLPLASSEEPSASLGRLMDAVLAGTDFRGVFEQRGQARTVDAETWREILAICREAMVNAARHSAGSTIRVRIVFGHRLVIDVADDGIGIDDIEKCELKKGHFGLRGMGERARAISGRLSFLKGKPKGTVVRIVLPVAQPAIPEARQRRKDR